MKDRVSRLNHKKAPKRLKVIAISISSFTMVFGALSGVALYHYQQENAQLSKAIDNYTTQIDLLEGDSTRESRFRKI